MTDESKFLGADERERMADESKFFGADQREVPRTDQEMACVPALRLSQPEDQGIESGPRADLLRHIDELNAWAQANLHDATRDTVAFWSLKIPAIVTAASAGVWVYLNLPLVSVIAGAGASLC